jgi:hypothetical protein
MQVMFQITRILSEDRQQRRVMQAKGRQRGPLRVKELAEAANPRTWLDLAETCVTTDVFNHCSICYDDTAMSL